MIDSFKYFQEIADVLNSHNLFLGIKRDKIGDIERSLYLNFPLAFIEFLELGLNNIFIPLNPFYLLENLHIDEDFLVFQEDEVEPAYWGIKGENIDDPIVYLKDLQEDEAEWISYEIVFSEYVREQLTDPLFNLILKSKLTYFKDLLDFHTDFLAPGEPKYLGAKFPSIDWIEHYPPEEWLLKISTKEEELGIKLPSTLREFIVYQLNEIFLTPDPFYRLNELKFESPFLIIQIENQGVYLWALKLDGTDNPPVFMTEFSDDIEKKWKSCEIRFVDYVIRYRIDQSAEDMDYWLRAYGVDIEREKLLGLEKIYKKAPDYENHPLLYDHTRVLSFERLHQDSYKSKFVIDIHAISSKRLKFIYLDLIKVFPHLKDHFKVMMYPSEEFESNEIYKS